jgi:hypothetical protein
VEVLSSSVLKLDEIWTKFPEAFPEMEEQSLLPCPSQVSNHSINLFVFRGEKRRRECLTVMEVYARGNRDI